MSDKYVSREFRNTLAHYKLGVILKNEDLIPDDPLRGLVQFYFDKDYYSLKSDILDELRDIVDKIAQYLNIKK